MANISQYNYEKFDRPYDTNLKRLASVPQGNNPIDIDSRRALLKSFKSSGNQIFSPFQLNPRVIASQTFNDIWIRNWIKSLNYKPGIVGLKIDGRKGEIEVRSIFTENLNIGNRTVYVDVAEKINQSIDNVNSSGGGLVILKNGTHKPGEDVILRNNVHVVGQSGENCIIDFENGAFGFKVQGTHITSAGTVTINTGSVIVNGAGTSFNSSMIGDYIFLRGIWYPINNVLGLLQLTISVPFAGVSLAAGSYIVADRINDCRIHNMIIRNSSTACIDVRYANEVVIKDVHTETSVIGSHVRDSSNIKIDANDSVFDTNGYVINNTHFFALRESGSIDNQGDSFSLTDCTSAYLESSFFLNSVDAGVKIDSCEDVSIDSLTAIESGGHGFELLGTTNTILINFCGARNNTSDGFNISGNVDKCKIIGCSSISNGGWGARIVDAACQYNQLALNTWDSNTSGGLSDGGTNTQDNNNITI